MAVSKKLQAVIDGLDETYELVYVDYRDQLTDYQIAALVSGDWETLYDSIMEWEMDARWEGVRYILDNEVDVSELDDDELDYLRWEIEDRDSSNPIRTLARNSGNVLLRISLPELQEDNSYGRSLNEIIRLAHIPNTESNRRLIQDALDNCCTEYPMAQIIASVSVWDVYNLPYDSDAVVKIDRPYLYIGNPYAGTGAITEEPLYWQPTMKRDDLTTDEQAWGYSVDDLFGGLFIRGSEINSETTRIA